MNFKKVIAVFTVLVMVLASVTAIVAYTPESESAALPDKGTVTLYVEKGWDKNADELKKLGITNPNFWTKTDDGYKVTMNNVKYQTSQGSPAILVIGNGVLTFDCHGTNEITCSAINDDWICLGIESANDDAKLCFAGDGVMNVTCSYPDSYGSAAISAFSLTVTGGCTLFANGSDVKPSMLTQTTTVGLNIEDDGNLTITDGATVVARGGDATVDDSCLGIISAGIFSIEENSTYKIEVVDSTFYAIGGAIKAKDLPHAASSGAMLSGNIDVTDSTVCFYGSTVEVGNTNMAQSNGMTLKGTMNAKNSTIVAASDDVSMGSRYKTDIVGMVESIGIEWNATSDRTFTAEGCACYIISGSCSSVEVTSDKFTQISAGLLILKNDGSAEFNLSLKGTMFDIEGDTAYYSYGFATYDNSSKTITKNSKIILDDSEIWAFGNNQAIAGTMQVIGTPLWSGKSNYLTTGWSSFNPSVAEDYDYKYITVGFKRNVYLMSVEEGLPQVSSYRVAGNTFILPECDFLAPDGKQFKCWSIDGDEYQPGETVTMGANDYYLVVNAEWEDIPVPAPSSDNGLIILVVCVIVALIAVALLATVLYVKK